MSARQETMSGWGIAWLSSLAALLLYVGGFFAIMSHCVRDRKPGGDWVQTLGDILYSPLPRPMFIGMEKAWERLDPKGAKLQVGGGVVFDLSY